MIHLNESRGKVELVETENVDKGAGVGVRNGDVAGESLSV